MKQKYKNSDKNGTQKIPAVIGTFEKRVKTYR